MYIFILYNTQVLHNTLEGAANTPKYSGIADCIITTWKNEGFKGKMRFDTYNNICFINIYFITIYFINIYSIDIYFVGLYFIDIYFINYVLQ